jgi:virginiamycin B lyase
VIVGPDGAPWVTEGGQNAIARVDPATHAVKLFPLPKEHRDANLNTATFDRQGMLWFTGQWRLWPARCRIKCRDRVRRAARHGLLRHCDDP